MRFTLRTKSFRLSGKLLSVSLLALGLWLGLASPGFAADTTDTAPPAVASDSTVAPQADTSKADTTLFVPPADPTIAAQVTNPVDLEQHLRQKPTVALFKSMFVPGLGQVGNHRYVKAAVIAGLQGWFVSKAVYWGQKASDAKSDFDNEATITERNILYNVYDEKRKKRNKFIWFAGITAFVSMFDAYVDAHLSGSPTEKRNEQFSFDVIPNEDGGVSASLAFNF